MKALVCSTMLALILVHSYTQEIFSKEQAAQNSASHTIDFPDSLRQHKIYLGTGLGFPWMFSADITYLSKRNIGISVNYISCNLKSENIPSDYLSKVWGFSSKPKDNFSALSALFVIDIRTGSQKVRPGFEAGISMVTYKEAYYRKQNPTAGIFIGIYQNYKVDYVTESFLGYQARVKLEVLFKNFLGCEFALAGNFNKYRLFVGLEAIFLIGKVREKSIPSY